MRVIPVIAFLLALAVPAWSAERVLLAPLPAGSAMADIPALAAELGELERRAQSEGTLRVVVGLRVPFAPEGALPTPAAALQRRDIAAAAAALRGRMAAGRSPPGFRAITALPYASLRVTPRELRRLASDPSVISITQDFVLRSSLAQSEPLIRAPEAWAGGFAGAGQVIAVIDTGVDKGHPFLKGKVLSEACYSQGGYCPGGATSSTAAGSGAPCPRPQCFHGTHVAGIAAGRGEAMSGVARDAGVISIQVFSPDPGQPNGVVTWFSDILAGLGRVAELRGSYRIAAVNLSLGSGRYTRTCDNVRALRPVLVAISNLRSAGIAVVAAAGNDGWPDAVTLPACISSAVSVGSVSDADWGACHDGSPTATDRVACYSNSASFLSLLAPGSSIVSAVPGGGFGTANGTSMAAPHVSGAFAVMRQKFPDAPVSEVLAALQASGRPVVDYRTERARRPVVKPRIDLAAALGRLVRLGVSLSGTGAGTVTIKTPRGTSSCAGVCSSPVLSGTVVKLTAKAARGSRFTGWTGGGCVGTRPCSVTMSEARAVTAIFARR